jgi:DNA-binding transcriptional LysR family regulator
MSEADDFPFDNEELRLLTLLSEELTVKKVAERVRRDQTTVTRQLNQLSQKHPVLQKNEGMWKLTPFGHEVAKYSRKMLNEQRSLVNLPRNIRIGTTKEFSEWVLAPKLSKIISAYKSSFQISVLSEVGSFESALMDGKIDFVLSCGKPIDPTIKFKRLKSFPMLCVHHKRFQGKGGPEMLMTLPAVEHTGLTVKSLLPNLPNYPTVVAQFDHISGVRGAVRAGLGWAILPQYSVFRDVEEGTLFEIPMTGLSDIKEEFSLWYMRDYSNLDKLAKTILSAFDS